MSSGLRAAVLLAMFVGVTFATSSGTMADSTARPSLEVTGVSGIVGEWELTATLAQVGTTRDYAGSFKMTHVGWCSQDGPEIKSGELQLTYAWLSSSRITATLRIDGVACAYQGRLSDAYTGVLSCPDRRPVPLTLWLR